MSISKKFITIWAGIGIPAGIISSIKIHGYLTNSTPQEKNDGNYEKVFNKIIFITWSIGIGSVFGLSWPITYPILINNYLDKENNNIEFCER